MIRFDGEREVGRRQLACDGADAQVCRRIGALLPELVPEPGEVCTEVYGGPERIVLRGRLGGEPVEREFSRRNGCEIHRYDRIEAVLPD